MEAAVKYIQDGMSLRKAAILYNVPVETTRRTVLVILENCNDVHDCTCI